MYPVLSRYSVQSIQTKALLNKPEHSKSDDTRKVFLFGQTKHFLVEIGALSIKLRPQVSVLFLPLKNRNEVIIHEDRLWSFFAVAQWILKRKIKNRTKIVLANWFFLYYWLRFNFRSLQYNRTGNLGHNMPELSCLLHLSWRAECYRITWFLIRYTIISLGLMNVRVLHNFNHEALVKKIVMSLKFIFVLDLYLF